MAATLICESRTSRGQVALSRRHRDGAVELRVNGVFVMDDVETSSERMLAQSALDAATGPPNHVFVGGLGLGFTLAAVLADARVERVTVAEIEPSLVGWHLDGTIEAQTQQQSPVLDDRVSLAVDDVRTVLGSAEVRTFDLVLLDVDNGPGYLVYEENAPVYGEEFLRVSYETLVPGGVVAIWSAETAPRLTDTMWSVFDAVEEWPIPVVLGHRATTYHLVLGHRSV